MHSLFSQIYENKTVLVTGHTGFKGSWLCFWLHKMGAKVIGYSLKAPTSPNHIDLLDLNIVSIIGDIRDLDKLDKTFKKYKPDIVFHLAAQALVRQSYKNPIETYDTNVMGTLKVFETCKKYNVKAIVNITSDKAYENKEWIWGYKETDPLGGYDPYSSSKGCAELLTSSYRNSYFNLAEYKKSHCTLLASCRAGNVIGGGDWAQDRLIPDLILSSLDNKKVQIRNPHATRPWQHVLEPLSGYLLIGQKLLEEKKFFASAWNFGPNNEKDISVEDVVKSSKKIWNKIDYEIFEDSKEPHEANLLKLDCSKAHKFLNWEPVWNSASAFENTINWYREYYENQNVKTHDDFMSYLNSAKVKNIQWSK